MRISNRIESLQAYIPPLDTEGRVRLFMNENLFGPSPTCSSVLKDITCASLMRYTSNGDLSLQRKLEEYLKVPLDSVTINHGSSEVIRQLFSIIITPGDAVLIPQPGWGYYEDTITLAGGTIEKYNLHQTPTEFKYSENEIIEKVQYVSAKAVVITSPNMPTGNRILHWQLESILEHCPHTFFVIDEAYWGFNKNNDLDINYYINKYKNIIFVRTFSKFFGLANARIGYMVANPSLGLQFRKAAPLFGITYISQLMAISALDDKAYYDNMRICINKEMHSFKEKLMQLNIFNCFSSEANFYIIRVQDGNAQSVVSFVKSRGFIVRDCTKYGLPACFRVTIGTPEINSEFLELLKEYDAASQKNS